MNDNPSPVSRVLCISPFFPPTADAEAFCAAKMVESLMQAGVCVTVLSSSNIRMGSRTDHSRRWDLVRSVSVDVPQLAHGDPLASIVTASLFHTPLCARWVAAVVKEALKLHKKKAFDLVYSRSLPAVAHIAGFWCARKLRLPWVANINDPWEINFRPGAAREAFPAWENRAYRFWLRRTLANADLITYPCEDLHAFHAALADSVHSAEIIPHIGGRAKQSSGSPFDGCFRLIHAGKLGANEEPRRSAKALLRGLRAFCSTSADAARRTRLVLIGPADDETQSLIRELSLDANVETTGAVTYEKSLEYIASASVCILIEAEMDESIFFPSKLADYVAADKPVLALSPRRGFAARLAARGELVRVDHNPAMVCDALTRLYSDFTSGNLRSRAATASFVSQLEAQRVATKFLTACEGLRARSNKSDSPVTVATATAS